MNARCNIMAGILDTLFKKCACTMIRLYQCTLSPDHGIAGVFVAGQCKFRPTCSEFAYEQIQHAGISALPSVALRIFHCR